MWLCFNKTLFTRIGGRPDLAPTDPCVVAIMHRRDEGGLDQVEAVKLDQILATDGFVVEHATNGLGHHVGN